MRLLLVLVLSSLAVAAAAQTLGRPPADGPSASLDVLTALGDDLTATDVDVDGQLTPAVPVDVTSVAAALSARVPVSGAWTAVAELPVAYSRVDFSNAGGETGSDAALGNPYLGAEVRLRSDVVVGGGVRLPLAPAENGDAAYGGLVANVEQVEAYLGRTASLGVAIRYTPRLTRALGLRLRLAPTLVASTDRERDGRTDVGVGYGLHLDARRGPLAASVGATGRQFLSDGLDGYGLFQADAAVALAASVDVGGVRPGLVARVPLADEVASGAAAVGLSLDVPLR